MGWIAFGVFAVLFLGGIALFLLEVLYKDGPGKDHGDPHGVTSGRSRVYAYVVCAILGFISMLVELWFVYG